MNTSIKENKCFRSPVLKRFMRDKDGNVAIEFAAVALPFFILIFGVLETAVVFLAGTALEFGMQEAARTVQTASIVGGETGFKNSVCDNAVMLPDCVANIKVDVRSYSNFAAATFPPTLLPDGTINPNTTFNKGGPGDTIVVRVSYEWPILNTVVGSGLGNMANGNKLLTASWAFQNEP